MKKYFSLWNHTFLLFALWNTLPCFQQRLYSHITFVEDSNETRQQDIYARYFQACYLHMKGNVADSFKAFQQVLSQEHPPYVYDGFFKLLFDTGQFKNICSLFEQKQHYLQNALGHNLDFQLLIAQAYLNMNREEKAIQLFKTLSHKYPDNEQVAYYTALSLIQNKQYKDALKYLDDLINKPTLQHRAFIFYFLKSKIYVQQKKLQDALHVIEEGIEKYPKFDRGWLLKATLLEQQGKIKEAIAGYKTFIDIVGSEPTIEKQLVQLLFAQKQYTQAAHYLKNMKGSGAEYFFDLALIEFKAENYDAALEHIDQSINANTRYTKAKLLKTDILLAYKKPIKALDFLIDALAQEPANHTLTHTLLLLVKTGIQKEDVIKALEDLNTRITPSMELLSALADVCIEAGNFKKGITYYESIYNLTHNSAIKAKIQHHIAYVLFVTHNHKALDHVIQKIFEHQEIHPRTYNLCAFYYATTGKDLTQALDWIDKALAFEPNSPYYLDTKGIILLNQGNIKEALTFFTTAHNLRPQDTTITQHLNQCIAQTL